MGRPWCGKGTLCTMLVQQYGERFAHFDMGAALRERATNDEDFARIYAQFESSLVPDPYIFETVGQRLTACEALYLLIDGVPRKLTQGQGILDFLRKGGYLTPLALHVSVTEEIAFERLQRKRRPGRTEQRLKGPALRSYFDARMRTFSDMTLPVIHAFKDRLLVNRVRTIHVRDVDPGDSLVPIALGAIMA